MSRCVHWPTFTDVWKIVVASGRREVFAQRHSATVWKMWIPNASVSSKVFQDIQHKQLCGSVAPSNISEVTLSHSEYGSIVISDCVLVLSLPIQYQDCKGKSVPLQAWSDPDGSRKLRFPDFMAMVQDCDKVVSLRHRPPLPPGNAPGTYFC